jgi:hypothetical protein
MIPDELAVIGEWRVFAKLFSDLRVSVGELIKLRDFSAIDATIWNRTRWVDIFSGGILRWR